VTEIAPAPIVEMSSEQLAKELARLLKNGLPATEAIAGEVLPNLRSVVARSIHPAVPFSRLQALNELLPRLIDRVDDESYAEATRLLFGLGTGTRSASLTERRRRAAKQLGYNADHFRTDVEPQLLQGLADMVHGDLLRYQSRVKRASESLEPTGDTPKLTADAMTHEC